MQRTTSSPSLLPVYEGKLLDTDFEVRKSELSIPKVNFRRKKTGEYSSRNSIDYRASSNNILSARADSSFQASEAAGITARGTFNEVVPSMKSTLSLKKTLPKLYTEGIHNNIRERKENLKGLYDVLYKRMLKAHGINVEREELKQVMTRSKPIFDNTYSVKYLGVIDGNNIGVSTQRIPFEKISKSELKSLKHSPRGDKQAVPPEKRRRRRKNLMQRHSMNPLPTTTVPDPKTRAASPALQWKDLEKYLASKSDLSPEEIENLHAEVQSKPAISSQEVHTHTLEDESLLKPRLQEPPPEFNSLLPVPEKPLLNFKMMSISEYRRSRRTSAETLGAAGSITERNEVNLFPSNQESSQFKLVPSASEPYIVEEQPTNPDLKRFQRTYLATNFFLPHKMQTLKKKQLKAKENHLSTFKKAPEIPQPQQSTLEDETKDMMMVNSNSPLSKTKPKTKSVEPQKRKEYIDELSVQEKFRTHEVKVLMAKKRGYSYAKLLGSVNSQEKPEDILFENTKKVVRLKQIREERRKAHKQEEMQKKNIIAIINGYLPTPEVVDDSGELSPLKKNICVKVLEPTGNPMYNMFTRIRERINEIPEEEKLSNYMKGAC